jgi:hypothetical protein
MPAKDEDHDPGEGGDSAPRRPGRFGDAGRAAASMPMG